MVNVDPAQSGELDVTDELVATGPSVVHPGSFGERTLMNRAIEVIGSFEKALRGFETPVAALNYVAPNSIIGSKAGQDALLTLLRRIEHGVF